MEGNVILGTDSAELERTAALFRVDPVAGSTIPLTKIDGTHKLTLRDTILASSSLYCAGVFSLTNSTIGGDLRF